MSQYQKGKSLPAVSANLRALRGALSQSDFAAFLGIKNQVTYHRYEAGRVPKADLLRDIANRIGITVDELLSPIPEGRITEILESATARKANATATQAGTKKPFRTYFENLSDDELRDCVAELSKQAQAATGHIRKFYDSMLTFVLIDFCHRRNVDFGELLKRVDATVAEAENRLLRRSKDSNGQNQ